MDSRKIQTELKELVVTFKETTHQRGSDIDIACIKAASEVMKAQIIAEELNKIKDNLHRIG